MRKSAKINMEINEYIDLSSIEVMVRSHSHFLMFGKINLEHCNNDVVWEKHDINSDLERGMQLNHVNVTAVETLAYVYEAMSGNL